MSVDREQVRQRVRAALEADPALREALHASTTSAPAAPSRAEPASHPVGIITERDITEKLQAGGGLDYPAGTRFTPLARETLERHRANRSAAASSAPRQQSSGHAPAQASPARGARDAVAVGADHGGFAMKEALAKHLRDRGFDVVDCGTDSTEACDYPVFARAVADCVRSGRACAGLVVDGAGIGSAMTVNKVPGVRAAHCHNVVEARNAREHNHAHVLTLGSGIIGPAMAKAIVDAFLATPFGEGRHARRVALIDGNPSRTDQERSAR